MSVTQDRSSAPVTPSTEPQEWLRAGTLEEVRRKGVVVVKGADRPIAVFAHGGDVAGATTDDPPELRAVVEAHRELLKMRKKPAAEVELDRFARPRHDQDERLVAEASGAHDHFLALTHA